MSFGAAIGAIAGQVGGNILQGATNYYFSKKLAHLQFQHQKEMMQNAHQWEVQDLRNAGLNPILSAGGSGASGSASAPVVTSGAENIAHSAMALKTAKEQQSLLRDQQALLREQQVRTKAETETARAQALNFTSNALRTAQETEALKRDNEFYKKNPRALIYEKSNKAFPTVGPYIESVGQALKDVGNSAKSLGDFSRKILNKSFKYEDSK